MNEMNDSRLSPQGSSCYDQLRVVVDMNDFMFSVHGFKFHEQLRVVDDMDDLRSRELRSLDGLNILRLWTI